jgi:mitochondrial cardiolipin hydrolase
MPNYVSCYFSPKRGAADTLIGFIDRCTETIDAAVYCITHDDVSKALIRAHTRGVRVRVITDNLQASNKYSDDELLIESGIPLIRAKQSGCMHNKFIIGDIDAVGTGSFNWTLSADIRNRENFVIIRLRYVVKQYQKEFDEMWSAFNLKDS